MVQQSFSRVLYDGAGDNSQLTEAILGKSTFSVEHQPGLSNMESKEDTGSMVFTIVKLKENKREKDMRKYIDKIMTGQLNFTVRTSNTVLQSMN